MLLKLYNKNNDPADLQRVIDLLNDGGLLIYPTDGRCHRAHLPPEGHRPEEEQPLHHLL